MRRIGCFVAALVASTALSCTAFAQVRVMGIDFPPQASAEDGRGIMTDAAMEALVAPA